MPGKDLTVDVGEGIVNLRVGAVIVRNGKFLMAGNDKSDFYYSVGGRLRFGESMEEAAVREVFEETGYRLKPSGLAFVHENFFPSESFHGGKTVRKEVYEISFFYRFDVPEDFDPRADFTDEGTKEHLFWVSPDEEKTVYPAFFRTEALKPAEGVKHFITRDGVTCEGEKCHD